MNKLQWSMTYRIYRTSLKQGTSYFTNHPYYWDIVETKLITHKQSLATRLEVYKNLKRLEF